MVMIVADRELLKKVLRRIEAILDQPDVWTKCDPDSKDNSICECLITAAKQAAREAAPQNPDRVFEQTLDLLSASTTAFSRVDGIDYNAHQRNNDALTKFNDHPKRTLADIRSLISKARRDLG